MPWNLFLSEKCVTKVVVVKPDVVVYFGLLLHKSEFGVANRKTGRRNITTSGLASEPQGRSFLPFSALYCRGIVHRRLEKLSIRKPGAPDLNLWPESTIQKPENTFKSARNGPKSREIDRNSKHVVVKPEVYLQNRK